MYMDVKSGITWKRVLAVVLSVCLILGLVQLPNITTQAEESGGKTYHDYQHVGNGEAATIAGNKAAALFTASQNENQGEEQVENVSFDLQAIEGADAANAKATVSLYVNPDMSKPDSGEFVCSTEVYGLSEGTNVATLDTSARTLAAGETFAVIVALEGDAFFFYADQGAETGKNFLANEDGSWSDLGEQNLYVNIRTKTSDVEIEEEKEEAEEEGLLARVASYFTAGTMEEENASEEGLGIALLANSGLDPALDRASIEIPVGTTTTLKINNAETDKTYTWISSDSDCVSVEETGTEVTVTAKKVGDCTVSVSDGDTFNAICAVKVTKNIANAKVTFANSEPIVYDGTEKTPDVVVTDGTTVLTQGVDYTLVYSDGVNETKAVEAGTATVTVNGQGNYGGNQSLKFNIAAKAFSMENVDVAVDVIKYGGTPQEELSATNPGVKDRLTNTQLELYDESTRKGDYKIVFSEAETDRYTEGVHHATLEGVGNYSGTIPFDYIVQVNIELNDNVKVTLGSESYVYTGKEIQPAFVVTYKGHTLAKDVDYTVAYTNNIDVSANTPDKPTITITGINGSAYTGTVDTKFEIVPKNISNSDHTSSTVMVAPDPLPIAPSQNGTSTKPDFELHYNGTTLEVDKDYTVEIVDENSIDWSTATSATLTITGAGNFTGTRTLDYTIGKDIKPLLGDIKDIDPVIYNGMPQTPTVTFEGGTGSDTLKEGTDYEVTYENNTNAGTATVIVRGINGYGGTLRKEFTINPVNLATLDDSCFSYESSQVYAPGGVFPEVTVTVGGYTLVKDEDYTLGYTNNTDVKDSTDSSAPTITVTACSGNFDGQKELNFSITKCPITHENISITGINGTYTYTGNPIEPGPIEVKYVSGKNEYTLTKDTDYTIEYKDNTEASNSASVTITGKGNYSSYKKITFSIVKIPVENLKIVYDKTTTPDEDVVSYDGPYLTMKTFNDTEVTLENNIKLYLNETAYDNGNGTPLVKGTDYTLSYENNDKVSKLGETASVTITGMGNYAGSVKLYFLIARDIATLTIDDIEQQTYTGEKIEISDIGVNKSWFKELQQGKDYTVAYENNVNVAYDTTNTDEIVAKAKVIITGSTTPTTNGCYYGETSKYFKIVPRNLEDENVSFAIKEQQYKGTAVTLDVANDISGSYKMPSSAVKELTAGTDFTISTNEDGDELYSGNEKVGTATVLLEGKGNFKGTREVNFEVVGKSVADDSITASLDVDTYMYSGSANTPTVTLVDDTYTLILNTDYTVSYSDNVNAGQATLTVTGKGNYSGTRELYFTIEPADISGFALGGVEDEVTYTGSAITPKPVITYTKDNNTYTLDESNYDVVYKDNENVGTTATPATIATITVTGKGNYTGTKRKEFKIVPKDISESDVIVDEIPPQAYTGVKVCPDLTITYGDYILKAGTDYAAEYTDNILNGKASVKITGKGNFEGEVSKNFWISTSILSSDFVITCEGSGMTYTYTGAEIRPAVTVTRTSLATTLVKGTDYDVTYKENVNAGTATVEVTGMKNYAGTKTFTFTIAKKNIADDDVVATMEKTSYEYTGSQITPKVISLFYGNLDLKTGSYGNDYKVVYGANTAVGTGVGYVTIDATDSSNFTGVKTLYFDIVAKSIGSGSSFATGFTMDAITTQGYTGSPVTPTPAVRYKKSSSETIALVLGTDYTLSYANNIEIGTASIIVTGIGNYQGSVTQTFAIKGSIEGAVVSGLESEYDYDGTAKTPVPTQVSIDGTILIKDVDYTLSYANNVNLGEATLTIAGIGNYGGSIIKTFRIMGDMADATVSTIANQPFTGTAITPSVVVEWNGKTLVKDTDYTLSYENNVNVGTATVVITGKGNFKTTSKLTTTFEIVPTDGYFVISEITDQYYCGSPITPEFTVTYNGKTLTEDTDYTVSWANNTNAGTATLTITGMDNYSAITTATKEFDILPLDVADMTLTDANPAVGYTIAPREYTGNAITPGFTLAYMEGETTVYTLKSSDYSVSYRDNVEVGIATMIITGSGTNCTGTRTETFQITQKDIANTSISQISNQTYTGKAITPSLTIKNGIRVLNIGTDYEVSYLNNIGVGTATAHIIGVGNYTGTKDVLFAISPMSLASSGVSITEIPAQAYTGSEVTPEVTVTYTDADAEVHTLIPGTDYTVSYSNNIAAGTTAKVIVTGAGNYTGTKTASFTISGHDMNSADVLIEAIPNQAYTGSAVTPAVTITCGDYTLVKGTDYTVTYSNNEEIGIATATITGKGNFAGERSVTFKIASGMENAVIVSGLESSYTYEGTPITPSGFVVQIGATVLTEGTDYTISYEDNIDVGTAKVILNGAENYGGTKAFTFRITEKSIEDEDVLLDGFIEDQAYTGEEVTQDITLTYGEQILQEGTDYTVSYTNNTEVGEEAEMVITGMGNYTGTLTKKFLIIEKVIFDEDIVVTNVSSTYTYSGSAIEPVPTVALNGIVLTEGTDYTVAYENNLNAGVAKLTITGKGNYSGSKEIVFNILRKSIMRCTFSTVADQIYTGKDITPEVSVSDGATTLKKGTDYTLMYSNNRKAGVASVIIAGKGNYTVTKTIRFKIKAGPITQIANTSVSQSSVGISWSESGAVTGYEVYRKTDSGSYERIARTRSKTYTDTGLTSGKTYSYKVRAYLVTDGETYYSSFSDVVQGTTR